MGTAPQVVVVGGGVTGCEAAWRAAELGAAVTLVTTSLDTVYALDGEPESAWAAPGSLLEAALEQGARSRWDVHRRAKYALEARRGVHLLQSTASSLLTQGSRVAGVETWEGVPRRGGAVALCVGTFLRARLRIGAVEERQGRLSEMAYDDLGDDLAARGFELVELAIFVPGAAGSLPHEVRTLVLAASEWTPGDLRLHRLEGLYAGGACVARSDGPPGVAECVAEGMRLGNALGGA